MQQQSTASQSYIANPQVEALATIPDEHSPTRWLDAVAASLDVSTRPRFVLDADCRLIVANAAGYAMLAAASVLKRQREWITPVGRQAANSFRGCVRAACSNEGEADSTVILARPLEHVPVLIRIGPLSAPELRAVPSAVAAATGMAWVDVADVRAPVKIDAAILKSLFGLTRRETDLAILLARGQTVAESAKLLGIAIETTRSHLKSIFAKTGVNGQAQLVRVLLLTAR